ncbi:hypothetical protein Pint_14035 [Pistacia integerrima]|uniref:Uncharacterized protein n=1 Tax=Pistacia integerrima TaxID=434235 RepID=A0ACC0Y3C1_9ROSI|nr:hypothetical protein Pint_14035 [Pistacia integerrima]
MGVCLSRNSSSSPTSKIFSNIRVVHLNGWVEEFDFPVSPLKPDILLERGRLYILLPSSIFQAGHSLADLATIVKKLTAKANSCKAETISPGSGRSNPSSWSQNNSSLSPVPETNGVKRWRPILYPIREVV